MHPFDLHLSGSWIQGLAWVAVFLLTLWPTRRRLVVASVLWLIGSLVASGASGYSLLVGVGMVMAFSSGPFPITALLLPLASLGLVFAEAALLRPSVQQDAALRSGRVLLLVVGPVFHLLPYVGPFLRGIPEFPFGPDFLLPAILWFRIRELQTGLPDGVPKGVVRLTPGDEAPQ